MKKVRILVDEDMPKKAVEFLISLGFDVIYVPSAKLKGMANGILINKAIKERRIFMTRDQDFLNEKRYPLGNHYGIVVFKLQRQNTKNLLTALERFLNKVNIRKIKGCLLIVNENKHTIKKPKMES